MKMKAEAHPPATQRGRALKQLTAGVRWMLSSWLKPAGREAKWEQRQHCPGEK